jgi:hypothetical protein
MTKAERYITARPFKVILVSLPFLICPLSAAEPVFSELKTFIEEKGMKLEKRKDQ